MNKDSVFNQIIETRENKGAGFFLLIDPDRIKEKEYLSLAVRAEECGVDAILVGSSFNLHTNFQQAVKQIKSYTSVPVILFPSSFAQISPDFDAVLFSSLLSGRNPNFLIDEQVKGAPLIKKYNLESIPTAYLLIESGSLTSAHYVSGTMPIPREKSDIAMAHALAGQLMGMKLVYLEAGSGAVFSVPLDMIRDVSKYVDIPLMVGGGLKTPESCANVVEAGASFVVVGTFMEENSDLNLLKEMTSAVHQKESVKI